MSNKQHGQGDSLGESYVIEKYDLGEGWWAQISVDARYFDDEIFQAGTYYYTEVLHLDVSGALDSAPLSAYYAALEQAREGIGEVLQMAQKTGIRPMFTNYIIPKSKAGIS